jgi:glycosyltransferase involved in cell wall biosynthesis
VTGSRAEAGLEDEDGDEARLRIVLTIHHFLDRATGAPGITLALAEEYTRLGHDVEVIGFDGLRLRDERLCRLAFPAYVAARLRGLQRAAPIDVVDASSGDAAVWCLTRTHGRRPLLVVRSHGLEHPTYESQCEDARHGLDELSWHYRLFQTRIELPRVRRTLRAADLVAMSNADDVDYAMDRLGVSRGRLHVVAQGLDDATIDAAGRRTIDAQEPTIVSIGTFIARKGVTYLVQAASELMTTDPRVRIRFLGTGVDAETVRAAFPPEVRSRVDVVPRYARDDLVELVGRAPIGVLASVREGSPVALLELMALGLASVVTTTPGMGDTVVDGETAVVVPPRDPEALRVALAGLLADSARATRIGAAARAAVEASRWSARARENLALYRHGLASLDRP